MRLKSPIQAGLLMLSWISLASCLGNSASAPAMQYYLLATPQADSSQALANPKIKLGVVRLPSYLDQLGIVLVTDDRQIQVANYHLWAEPLTEAIARKLEDEISASWNGGPGILNVDIHFYHGDPSGTAILDATWTLILACGESVGSRFRDSRQQNSSGYFALVETHAQLLENLSRAVVESEDARGACGIG